MKDERFAAVALAMAVAGTVGCKRGQAPAAKTTLDLGELTREPERHEWFQFRPNLKKLILSGAAETEHVAILWYTVPDGKVGLHLHSKTESVYVIEGSQTDGKGVYPTGVAYFNPPGSGHEIRDSSGFFILAYASPPDFKGTDAIGEYTPLRVDTGAADIAAAYPFVDEPGGASVYQIPLAPEGGMTSELVRLDAASAPYRYSGNYLLVVEGRCEIDGHPHGERRLVVAHTVEPQPFSVTPSAASGCTLLALGFKPSQP